VCVLVASCTCACSGGGLSSPDGGGVDSAADTSSGDACSSTCAVSTPTCGIYEACGQVVECGFCTFAPSGSAFPYTAAVGISATAPLRASSGAIEQSYVGQDGAVHVAEWNAGTWSDEVAVATPTNNVSVSNVSLAVGPSGTRWVAYAFGGAAAAVLVTSAPEGGPWTPSASLPNGNILDAIAVGSDGTPWVSYRSQSNFLNVATLSASAWTATQVVNQPITTTSLLAVGGTQPVVVFWESTVQFAQKGAAGWTSAPISDLASYVHGFGPLALAADGSGHVALVAQPNDKLSVLTLAGTTWTTTQVLDEDLLPDEVPDAFSATYDTNGTLWIATAGNDASYLINVTPQAAPVQRLFESASGVQIVPDAVNGVALLSGNVLTRSGTVPTSYSSECDQVASSICHSACQTCITAGPCGWAWSNTTHGSSSGNTYGTAADCMFAITLEMCGDLSDDAGALGTCVSALPTTTCIPGGGNCTAGCADLPSPCADLYTF
jgi:hypothetical protein